MAVNQIDQKSSIQHDLVTTSFAEDKEKAWFWIENFKKD